MSLNLISDEASGGWQRRAEEKCHARHYEVSLADDAHLAARIPVVFLNKKNEAIRIIYKECEEMRHE